jgi:hypothetical protein
MTRVDLGRKRPDHCGHGANNNLGDFNLAKRIDLGAPRRTRTENTRIDPAQSHRHTAGKRANSNPTD